ncbi:MAG: flagellar biosynthesis protein FliQ [Pirellulales bacterium]
MNPAQAVDLGREAILVTLIISSPVLIAGMAVGLGIGLLQALTQIQEQTVAFVPKIIAMALTLSLTLPWILTRMVEYFRELVLSIPDSL